LDVKIRENEMVTLQKKENNFQNKPDRRFGNIIHIKYICGSFRE